MKTISFAFAAFALTAATAGHAVEASRFEVPTHSTLTRAEVRAEARQAAAAGELRHGEAGQHFGDPAASTNTAKASSPLVSVPTHDERHIAGHFAIGGM
ncbi:DUF4148 domain-containing protein [Piscinibacter sakaiensis]|uniref:DUF4148 domain-containing protein n=1 Tax=Piscinibacter sakaiensis TaxID=1547922 RepID=UPI003AAB3DBC